MAVEVREEPVPIAVIGAGHLGRHHARILNELSQAKLCGVVDLQEDRARELAQKLGVPHATDPLRLPEAWVCQAVCVVTPTVTHADIASFHLARGMDVLVEKPLTKTVAEAKELCRLAREENCILQVGHVERFNPVVQAVMELDITPRYIEGDRLAPFSFRSTDIGVVMDLMIHDLDLLQLLIDSPVIDVEAFGGAIFTPAEDVATARLRFENGAVARLTANRVALKPARRMRMFSKDAYVSLDFDKKYGLIIKKGKGWDLEKLDLEALAGEKIENLSKFVFEGLLDIRELNMAETDPLEAELASFINCVQTRQKPLVDGETGQRALDLAYRVMESIAENPW